MTKAEERRALLQTQKQAQPTQQNTLSKADERRLMLRQQTQSPAQPTATPAIAPIVAPTQTPIQQPTSQPAPQVAPVQSAARNEFAQYLREQGNNDVVVNTLLGNMTDKDVENELAKVKRTPVQKATAPVAQNNSAYSNLPSHEMTNVDRAARALGNIGGTIGTATVSGSAKALNAAKRADDWLTGNDSTAIDPQKLLAYANGNHGILEDRDMTILWNLANERQDNLRVLYNRLYYNDPTLTADEIKDYLNKSQKHVEDSDYMKWVEPSERKFEQQQKTNIENYNPGYANALNTVGNIAEVAAPTTLAAVAKVPTPVTFGIGGAIAGENKMQQYLEQGKSYEEARKEIPIETAKGVVLGTIFQVAKPIMSSGMISNPSTLAEAGKNILRAFVNGLGVGSAGALTTQQLDWLKDDPNYDYMNWDNINQGIQEGKYKDLNDYINSDDYIKDVAINRVSQIGLAGVLTGGFNVLSTVPGTINAIKQTIARGKYDPTNDLKLLGLEKGATQEQINKAYRQWAKINRPDQGNVSSEANTEIKEAVERLRNYKQGTVQKFVNNLKDWFKSQKAAPNAQNATPQQQALIPQTASSLANAPQPETVGISNVVAQNIVPNATSQNLPNQLTTEPSKMSTNTALQDTTQSIMNRLESDISDDLTLKQQTLWDRVSQELEGKSNQELASLANQYGLDLTEADFEDGDGYAELSTAIEDKAVNELKNQGYELFDDEYFAEKPIRQGYENLIDWLDEHNIDYETSRSSQGGLVPSIYIKNANGDTVMRIANHHNHNTNDYNSDSLYTYKDYTQWQDKILPDVQDRLSTTNNTMLPTNEELQQFENQQSQNELNKVAEDADKLNLSAGTIPRQNLLNMAEDFEHKGEVFVDEKMAKSLNSNSNIIKLADIKLDSNNINKLRELAREWAKKFIGTREKNIDTDTLIDFSGRGVGETIGKDMNTDKALSIRDLPRIVREAIYKNSSLDTKDKNNIYHYLVALAENGKGEHILNYITLKQTPEKTKFHYNTTQKIEGSSTSLRPGDNAGVIVPRSDEPSVNNSIPPSNPSVNPPSEPEPPDNAKVRKHVETIANAPGTPKEVAKDIRNDARKYYVPQSNEETMENARAIIGDDIEKAERTFLQRESLETAEDVAVADLLMQDAVSKGDYKRADELAIALSQKFTKAGQVMQAANIIKNLSPSGMLVYAEKELDNATRTIKKDNPNFYKKLKEQGIISKNDSGVEKIQLTDDEKKQIVDNMQKAEGMPEGREKDILIAKTMKLIGDKIPATALEKVAALRRNGLLTNFKTLNRNLGSNGGFGILEMIKDVPATIIDSITSLFTGKRTTRLPNIGAAVKGLGKGFFEAVQDLWYGIDTTDGTEGKYGKLKKTFKREDTWKDIWDTFKTRKGKEAAKKVFNRLLSDYEDIAGFLVNGTDRPFYNARFESELANQMKLGGLKYGEDLPTDEMKEIAKESADYATFKNKNALSSSLSQLRNTLNFKKPIGAADAIGLTFTNVPGSVGSKISDYTIGGATKVLKEIYNAATKNGKFNQRKFVDYLGRVITGTGAIALLVPLIKNKILTGSYDDDKDKADIEREMGIQQNSINLTALKRLIEGKDPKLQEGDKFYNFDWLQPVSGLAILGTNLYNKATQGSEQVSEAGTSKLDDENEYYIKKTDDTNIGDVVLEGLRTVANQVADMSSLGNFADLFRGYEGLGGNIIDIPGNFASSFIPTLSNNLGQYTDETARNTKDYTSRIKTNINKLKNKIPGVRETLTPKVATTGEEKKQYVDGNDFISTFINPGYMTTYNPTDVQKELQSVYEDTGDKTIYPGVAPSGITYNKERVTLKPKGVETYQKASGKYASEVYDALFDNEFYKSLEPESKAKVLKQIADDSREVGKAAIGIETNNYFKLDTKREELDKGSLSLADYYLYASQLKGITAKNTKKTYIANITNSINNKEGKDYIDKKDKEILYDIFGVN